MKIFVPKNKIMAMSNPEFFFSKLTLIRRACSVYIKLIVGLAYSANHELWDRCCLLAVLLS